MAIWSAEIKELERLYESFKDQFPELEKELLHLIKTDDENVILLYARRCLEIIITNLCECELNRERGSEPLKGIIDKLNKEKKIPAHIASSMYGLNEISTYGTHPKDFDPEQVKPVLNNLDIIIKWYIKYKDTKINNTGEAEGIKDEIKVPDSITKRIQKSKKRLIILLSGILLVVAIVVMALFLFDIIGSGRQIKELEKSIAVLPFEVWNSDEEFQYLGNAIANEINTQLCIVKKFHVISYTSSSRYKGSEKPPIPQIGKELGANFIIEGFVERQLDSVSIHVQVINAKKDDHFWAQEFKDKWNNLIALRADIAKKVADVLNTSLTPEEKQRIEKIPTKNITAYDLTLKAQEFYYQYLNNRDTTKLEKAAQFSNIAIDLDSGFALAYYWLGKCSLSGRYMSGNIKPFYLDTALYFFNKALELDPNFAEGYADRGAFYYEKSQRQKAFDDLKRSVSLSPNNSLTYLYLGTLYFRSRDYINALINLKKAETLLGSDDYLAGIYSVIYFIYLSVGDLQKADSYCKKTEQFNPMTSGRMDMWMLQIQGKNKELLSAVEKYISHYPDNEEGYAYKAETLIVLGRIKEAEDCIILRIKYSGPDLNNAHRIGYIFWTVGKRNEAMKYFNMQINNCITSIKANDTYGQSSAAYDLAGVYATLGNNEEAKKWLREYEKSGFQSGLHEFIKTDFLFDNLRDDEEFKEIVKRANEKADENRAKISEMEEQGML